MNEDHELEYLKVPSDFPRPVSTGALPGNQPKFLVTSYQGKFYLPGCTPQEIYERWQICEEIVQQLAIKSRESKEGRRSHMSQSAILEQYFAQLVRANLMNEAEARWVIQRVAMVVDWPVPSLSAKRS